MPRPACPPHRSPLTRLLTPVASLGVLAALACSGPDEVMVAPESVSPPPPATLRTIALPAADRISDEYIVVFKSDVVDTRGRARALAVREQAELRFTYTHALQGFSARMSTTAAERLAAERDVAYIEPNARVHADGVVTETLPTGAWGLDRIDTHPRKLNATYAYTSMGAGVTAYVIDTGIDYSHPEFEGRASYIGQNYASTFGGQCTVREGGTDNTGHGTHVAGIIGGRTYGVAKAVSLVGVPIIGGCGFGSLSGILAGMDAVIAHHHAHPTPAVANMSVVANGVFQSVFDAAASMVNAGITLTVAAGNGRFFQDYDGLHFERLDACAVSPAGAPAVVAVGATDRTDHEADFSNYGQCVDVLAPGVDVLSSFPSYDSDNPTQNTLSGTSQAAPHVAGAVARYLSLNPTATPKKVRADLFGRATPGVLTLNSGNPTSTVNLLLYTDPKR